MHENSALIQCQDYTIKEKLKTENKSEIASRFSLYNRSNCSILQKNTVAHSRYHSSVTKCTSVDQKGWKK